MEKICCPICGSEKIERLSDEQYECQACDSVFNVHNLSKEFRMTDEHIGQVHDDIKKIAKNVINSGKGGRSFDSLVLYAENCIKVGNMTDAAATYKRITEKFPEKYLGWFGLIRVKLKDFRKNIKITKSDLLEIVKYRQVALQCTDCEKDDIHGKVDSYLQGYLEQLQESYNTNIQYNTQSIKDLELSLTDSEKQYKTRQTFFWVLFIGAILILLGVSAFIGFKITSFSIDFTLDIYHDLVATARGEEFKYGLFESIGRIIGSIVLCILSLAVDIGSIVGSVWLMKEYIYDWIDEITWRWDDKKNIDHNPSQIRSFEKKNEQLLQQHEEVKQLVEELKSKIRSSESTSIYGKLVNVLYSGLIDTDAAVTVDEGLVDEIDEDDTPYKVVLENCGEQKMAVIKFIKDYFDCSLSDAKNMVESCPVTLYAQTDYDTASEVEDELESLGATVTIIDLEEE